LSNDFKNKDEGGFSRRDLLRGAGLLGAGAMVAATVTGCGSNQNDFVVTNNNNPVTPAPTATPTPTPTVTPTPTIPPVTFVQPEVLSSVGGTLEVPFNIAFATNVVGTPNGPRNFRSRTINGTISPPTIRLKPGDHLTLPVINNLPANLKPNPAPADQNTPHAFNTFNIHTHGLHVSPGQDNVLLAIMPGSTYVYNYDIPANHPAGTFWYHPHKHGATAMHSFSGMIGSIIIEGGLDNVPEIAAAADLVFNINELQLGGAIDPTTISAANPFGQADQTTGFNNEAAVNPVQLTDPYEVPPYTVANGSFNAGDSVFVVNGEFQPTIQCRPGQLLRLRMLNASARNTGIMRIANESDLTTSVQNWNVISLDGITLPNVKNTPSFALHPANRADVLVKIDTPGSYKIVLGSFPSGGGMPPPDRILATIEVAGTPFPQPLPAGPLPVPAMLPTITAGELNQPGRTVTYSRPAAPPTGPEIPNGSGMFAANFVINGQRFDDTRIDQIINLNSVIEWTLVNPSGQWHPHHIHINPFQVISTVDPTNGNNVLNGDPNMNLDDLGPTWMDTIAIPPGGSVTTRQRFPDFPGLFVQHCHILVHEDIGMMQLVNVI
jgi:FtsP/CotA-like multicopper oxidase with cupredoxin domain